VNLLESILKGILGTEEDTPKQVPFMGIMQDMLNSSLLQGILGLNPQQTPSVGQLGEATPESIFSYLTSKGVPKPHALGMISNIKAESNFDPKASGDQGTSIGLFQHHGPRKKALEDYAGPDIHNWQKQIDFALTEPESQRYLQTPFQSPEQASQWWTIHWERPSKARKRARQRLAYIPKW